MEKKDTCQKYYVSNLQSEVHKISPEKPNYSLLNSTTLPIDLSTENQTQEAIPSLENFNQSVDFCLPLATSTQIKQNKSDIEYQSSHDRCLKSTDVKDSEEFPDIIPLDWSLSKKKEAKQENLQKLDFFSTNFDPRAVLDYKDVSMIKNIGDTNEKFNSVEEFGRYFFKDCAETSDGNGKLISCTSEYNTTDSLPCQPICPLNFQPELSSVDKIQKQRYELHKRHQTSDTPPVPSKMNELEEALKSMKEYEKEAPHWAHWDKDRPMAILKRRIDTGRRMKLIDCDIFNVFIICKLLKPLLN